MFNIHGNSHRLIVDIEYRLKIIFIVWFGTHKQYDLINAKTVSYVKPIKTEENYDQSLARVYELIQAGVEENSAASDELEVLSILIKEYEHEHYPVPSPKPLKQ